MDIVFILVAPARPANVGAVARALKTMGFNHWRLVASSAHLAPEAGYVAHGAGELLQQVECFDTVAEAIADCDLVVATTARRRGCVRPYHPPQQLRSVLEQQQQSVARAALLFGCEESGLANSIIDAAQLLSTIPLAAPQPSLNLAQAVMVYAYALSPVVAQVAQPVPAAASLQALRQKLTTLVDAAGASEDGKLNEWLQDRLGLLTDRDCRMLHTLATDLLRLVNNRSGNGQ